MEKEITKRQNELLTIIYSFTKNEGFPPSFEDMREKLKVSSNQTVLDILLKLEEKKLVKRNESAARGITLTKKGYQVLDKLPLVPVLGFTHAGNATETIVTSGNWKQLSPDVALLEDDVFLLKVTGDSMVGAGIDDGDMALVKKTSEFINGDIVLAEVGNESTIKRFVTKKEKAYTFFYLKPENPNYKNINFDDNTKMTGKVIAVIKDGGKITNVK